MRTVVGGKVAKPKFPIPKGVFGLQVVEDLFSPGCIMMQIWPGVAQKVAKRFFCLQVAHDLFRCGFIMTEWSQTCWVAQEVRELVSTPIAPQVDNPLLARCSVHCLVLLYHSPYYHRMEADIAPHRDERPPNPCIGTILEALGGPNRRKTDNALAPYIRAARFFHLGIDLFGDLKSVLYDGIEKEFSMMRDRERPVVAAPDPLENEESRRLTEYKLKLYRKYCALVPNLPELVDSFQTNPIAMKQFIQEMATAATRARSEDIRNARVEYIRFILPGDYSLGSFQPPFDVRGPKLCRGFHHPQTARLLVPQHAMTEFLNGPEAFMDAVNAGTTRIYPNEFPHFLWDDEKELVTNPNDRRFFDGFLRGKVLVRVYRAIFSGPSSSLNGMSRRPTKAPKGHIHALHAPTPRTIAYAATMAWFMMCSTESWTRVIEELKFDLQGFYKNLIAIWDEDDGLPEPWRVNTMQWWKTQVPRLSSSLSTEHGQDKADGDRDNMAAMRRYAYGPQDEDGEEELYLDPPSPQRLTVVPENAVTRRRIRSDEDLGEHGAPPRRRARSAEVGSQASTSGAIHSQVQQTGGEVSDNPSSVPGPVPGITTTQRRGRKGSARRGRK